MVSKVSLFTACCCCYISKEKRNPPRQTIKDLQNTAKNLQNKAEQALLPIQYNYTINHCTASYCFKTIHLDCVPLLLVLIPRGWLALSHFFSILPWFYQVYQFRVIAGPGLPEVTAPSLSLGSSSQTVLFNMSPV